MPSQKHRPDAVFDGQIRAPEFPKGMEWLNSDSAITLRSLRGKFILLDFWTYCCINCMHVLPDLHRLEQKYSKELVVIGVHSAKFPNEQDTRNIRQAILRYGITHPVVNDKDFAIWEEYTIHAWPTLVLINPEGRIIRMLPGEGAFTEFDPLLAAGIRYFQDRDLLNEGKMQFALESEQTPSAILSYPGKISAHPRTSNLYITDSGNNRILVTDTSGAILDVIGNGSQGHENGLFDEASFNHPQGTCLDGSILYIADTENHTIRAANLKTRTVTTIFGNGTQAQYFDGSAKGTDIALNSPWDVLVHSDELYIAMAGSHQIWAANPATGTVRVHAGSGKEGRRDDWLPLATLAQPSGLATDGKRLYFTDAESSSIRWADFDPKGNTGTIVGEDLFEFGDADGDFHVARLQHPLGIAYADGMLYVADTYNSKIKMIDIERRTSMTYSGTGRHGYENGTRLYASYYEPGGLCALGDNLYITDTNNGQVRVIHRKTNTVSTLSLSRLERIHQTHTLTKRGRRIALPIQSIRKGTVTIHLSIPLPDGYTLTPDAPHSVTIHASDVQSVTFDHSASTFTPGTLSIDATYTADIHGENAELIAQAIVYYCKHNSDRCMVDMMNIHIPLHTDSSGPSRIDIRAAARAEKSR